MRKILVRVAVGVAAAVLAGAGPGHGAAAEPAGANASVAVRGDDPMAPVVVVTNTSDVPCQLASTSYGTVTVLRAGQGGANIEPILIDAAFGDGLDTLIAERLTTLEPGSSADIRIPVVAAGPTGHALEVVTWSAGSGPTASLYPVRTGDVLDLSVQYALPIQLRGTPEACTPGVSAGPVSRDSGVPWLLIGLGAGALVLMAALVVFLIRRRKHRASAVPEVSAVLLLIALGLLVVDHTPASASISVDSSLSGNYAPCSGIFTGAGGDPGGLLGKLNDPNRRVSIQRPSAKGDDHTISDGAGGVIIFWDPDTVHKYAGGGGSSDPCSTLYHEMVHAADIGDKALDDSPCVTAADGNTGIPTSEVKATRVQNQLRAKLGKPVRTHYGDAPLPKGDCLPKDKQPPAKNCTGAGCGVTTGDPHIVTFDGVRFDAMGVGELVASRDPAGGFEIQTRQEPVRGSRIASVNTAVALDVAGDRVEIRGPNGPITMLINGTSREPGALTLPHQGKIQYAGGYHPSVTVTWPDGSVLGATTFGYTGIHLTVEPAKIHAGKLEGMLGDFNGDKANDLRPRGGDVLAQPISFDDIHKRLSESWRLTAATSLFTYDAGTSTDTYTDRTFPDQEVTAKNAPNRGWAEAICRREGVTDPAVLEDCILDVAVSGNADFALPAARSQSFVNGVRVDGSDIKITIGQPGQVGRTTFAGTAGQQIFVQVVSSNLPDACGILALRDPSGQVLSTGCIVAGTGRIDVVTLPAAGEYTVEADPPGPATGEAVIRIVTAKDERLSLVPGGPAVTARVDQAGAVARLTFPATAGQKVYVDADEATGGNACNVLLLRAPDSTVVQTGCLINGVGNIDRTVLAATGTYTVEFDPQDVQTGQVRLRLVVATDQEATIAVNGGPVTAKVSQPGALASFTFTGNAGVRIFVDVSATNLPDRCGVLRLLDPAGQAVTTGCVINGTGELAREGTVLPASGVYTLVVDPTQRDTGEATLRLRT